MESGGEQRVEVVVDRAAQVQLFGSFEQAELVECLAQAGERGFPGLPLAEDVVAGLVGGRSFGEMGGGVAFAFPVGQVRAGEYEVLARPFGPSLQFLP